MLTRQAISNHLTASADAFAATLTDARLMDEAVGIAWYLIHALKSNRKILLAGNGGSAADAAHLAGELVGRYRTDRRPLPVIALTADSVTMTAVANDYGYEHVFARQIEALGNVGDVFIALSTSGRSPNILRALEVARKINMLTIGLTGASGGDMAALCDVCLRVPSEETPLIQQVHMAIGHAICGVIELHFTDC